MTRNTTSNCGATASNTMHGPLAGVRVIDLTSVLMGPYATQHLADLGADVIKVEPPCGDTLRGVGPMRHSGMGHIFLHANRNKRSLVLDLKNPEGLEAFYALARTADVVVYNIRPQAMKRLGITYERLAQENPRVIYAGLYGYSETGPYSGRPAYDDLIQGGVSIPTLVQISSGEEPRYVPLTLADRTVGLMASTAISSALVAQARSGRGQEVEIPMFETMTQFVLGDHLGGETFEPALGSSGYPRLLVRERKPYRTLDGYLCVLLYNDGQWQRFLELVGKGDLFHQDKRFSTIGERTRHIGDVYAVVAEALEKRTTAQWMEDLARVDVPCMPLKTIEDLLCDPHLKATGMLQTVKHPTEGMVRQLGVPVRMSGTPPRSDLRPAPRLGQDSVALLKEAGYADDDIQRLLKTGVTAEPGVAK
jgi:crotonobetainyl-CoA:carnitine CoA-transferase CaiB-like acyl-CoA transferase